MRFLFKHKLIWSLLLSLLFVTFILPITEGLWFDTANLTHKAELYSNILRLLFGISLTATIWFVIFFTEKVYKKDAFYRSWLVCSLIYLAVVSLLFVLIFPGYWVWDEFFVLDQSRSYTVHSWQHVFTQIQYIFSLYIFPSSTGVTFVQLLSISTIVGFIVAKVKQMTSSRWLWLLCFLPLISLPVLLGNFYTLRLHIYGYILVLFLFLFIMLYVERRKTTPAYGHFIAFVILIALLAFWRSEGLIYLLTLPFIAYRLNILSFGTISSFAKSAGVIVVALGILLAAYLATSRTEEPHYKLTASINPLSMLIHDQLKGKEVDSAWADINRVLNLEILRKYPSYTEIPSVWRSQSESVFREGYEAHLDGYYDGFAYIILNNPTLYLKYKLQTFLATNSMSTEYIGSSEGWLTPYLESGCSHLSAEYCERLNTFASQSKINGALNAELRSNTLDFLLLDKGQSPYTNPLRTIIWNVTGVLLALITVALHALITRRFIWSAVAILLLGHTAIVFLTAPANYFMYYFPVYVAGGLLSIIYLTLVLDARISRKREKIVSNSRIITGMNTSTNKVLIAIPAYNCAKQITRVLRGIDTRLLDRVDEIAVIDNGSTDDTVKNALAYKKTGKLGKKLHVYRNIENYNLGGTHKVAFGKAEREGYTHVIILHGDDQAKSAEANDLLDFAESHPQQTVLGSRFGKHSRLVGYDTKRIIGNKVLNGIYSVLTLRQLEDLGSGLNLFYVQDLDKKTYLKFADKLTFNYELILDLVKRKVNFAYLPITWSEDDQVSNARNVNIFKTGLTNVLRWRINKPAVNEIKPSYICKEVK